MKIFRLRIKMSLVLKRGETTKYLKLFGLMYCVPIVPTTLWFYFTRYDYAAYRDSQYGTKHNVLFLLPLASIFWGSFWPGAIYKCIEISTHRESLDVFTSGGSYKNDNRWS